MKKFMLVLLTFICLYAIYHDFKHGTLEALQQSNTSWNEPLEAEKENSVQEVDDSQAITYKEQKVEPGATVLSIAEEIHGGTIPVSIGKLVADFKEINEGLAPEFIQIGETYKFPVY